MVRVTLPTGRQEWPNGHGQLLGFVGLVKKVLEDGGALLPMPRLRRAGRLRLEGLPSGVESPTGWNRAGGLRVKGRTVSTQ